MVRLRISLPIDFLINWKNSIGIPIGLTELYLSKSLTTNQISLRKKEQVSWVLWRSGFTLDMLGKTSIEQHGLQMRALF